MAVIAPEMHFMVGLAAPAKLSVKFSRAFGNLIEWSRVAIGRLFLETLQTKGESADLTFILIVRRYVT